MIIGLIPSIQHRQPGYYLDQLDEERPHPAPSYHIGYRIRSDQISIPHYHDKEWDRNNFPMGITIEYSTTGQAGGYLIDSAPESTHQPVQPLGGS